MKTITLVFSFVLLSCSISFAQAKKAAMKSGDKYFVQLPHTKEECLAALDEIKAKGMLDKLHFGCNYGDHTGYGILKGSNETAVRAMLSAIGRDKAKVQRVEKFTPAQVEGFHK